MKAIWTPQRDYFSTEIAEFYTLAFCCSVAKSCLTFCDPWTATHQASLSFTTPRVCSNSCPLSQWCHPTIASSVISFSSCLQSFPASGSFPMSLFFASGGQSIRVSASASILPMNIQDWFPLGLTSSISLLSKGLSRVFSNTTVQKHQFFGTPPSLWYNSHIHTWLLEKPKLWLNGPLVFGLLLSWSQWFFHQASQNTVCSDWIGLQM